MSMEKLPTYCFERRSARWNTSNGTLKCVAPKGLHRTVEPIEFCSWGEKQEDEMEKLIKARDAIEFADMFFADPILKAAALALINNTPSADEAALISSEKQAAFRLGQMEMKESIITLLQDAASDVSGIIHSTLLEAAAAIAKLEVTS